tara:strand:- start:1947 stop:2393 length:447 start_codon:yes stop_codon:yes gene_type:complete
MAREFPLVSSIQDDARIRPFKNGTGSSAAFGDVVCWTQGTGGRESTQTTSATNQFDPAGIVAGHGQEGVAVPDGGFGFLYTSGRVQAKVLGASGTVAGDVLKVVASQPYLSKDSTTATPSNSRHQFVLMEDHETAAVALKYIRVDLPE